MGLIYTGVKGLDMERCHVVVTFDIDEEEKELLLKRISQKATLTFLSDLNEEDRKKELQAADVLFPGTPKGAGKRGIPAANAVALPAASFGRCGSRSL